MSPRTRVGSEVAVQQPRTKQDTGSDNQDLGTSRFDRAYLELRDRIVQGIYQPNQRLTEMDLSKDLGVSRPTIRMALVRLEQEGLVVSRPNRGASVRSMKLPEALSTLRVREVLEGLTATLAAESATRAELDEMAAIIKKMERLQAPNELAEYSAQNAKLHALILRAARDENLERLVSSLNHALVRYQYRTVLVPGRRDQSLEEHRAIVCALKKRDAVAAEQAMRTHVSHVRDTLSQSATLLV